MKRAAEGIPQDTGSPTAYSDQSDGDERNPFEFTFESFATSSKRAFYDDLGMPGSESASLSSSILDYPEEYGRSYHAYQAGIYLFPNDVIEQDRVSLQNQMIDRLRGNRLFSAPFSDEDPPRTVLDIATGTGDWAIRIGERFPDAKVTATDLSPIQPTLVPPNVFFYVEDSSLPWVHQSRFDFIHTRSTAGAWRSFEDDVAQQAFEWLNPGGYLESCEIDCVLSCDDDTLDPNGALACWFANWFAATEYVGRSLTFAPKLKEIYERVGFEDVQERVYRLPTNEWPDDPESREIGAMNKQNLLAGVGAMSYAPFAKAFGMSLQDIEVVLMDVRREIADKNIHAYMRLYVVWGKKPQA